MRQAPYVQVEGDDKPHQRVVGMLGAEAARFAFVRLQFHGRMPCAGAGYGCAAIHGLLPWRG